jgi:hypothetical protein
MFSNKGSYDTEPVIPSPVTEFENQTNNLSIQSILYPISVKRSYNTELFMSAPVAEFENQTPSLSIQSVLYLISAEQDVRELIYNKSEETKRGLENDKVRLSKKQRTK